MAGWEESSSRSRTINILQSQDEASTDLIKLRINGCQSKDFFRSASHREGFRSFIEERNELSMVVGNPNLYSKVIRRQESPTWSPIHH
jgi:hypothetical protein